MARRPTKISEQRTILELNDVSVPVKIITERGRTNMRASITSKALIIRVPDFVKGKELDDGIQGMLDWACKTYAEKPETFAQFKPVELASRYTFTIQGQTYEINVLPNPKRHHKIHTLSEGKLLALLHPNDPRAKEGTLLPLLLAKHFGHKYLPMVEKRVRELNDQHFKKPINTVKLSNTSSRWGSCSSQGNINISTRLLLAPPEILDAVIIHELAHLVEANHSDRFWAQVARALPNYKVHDRWLKENGKSLSFRPEVAED